MIDASFAPLRRVANAYAENVGGPGASLGGAGRLLATAADPSGTKTFADTLHEATEGVLNTVRHSEAVSKAGLAGTASIQDVVQAVTAAEMSLQTVTAIRDRVVSAYQEILRQPI